MSDHSDITKVNIDRDDDVSNEESFRLYLFKYELRLHTPNSYALECGIFTYHNLW